MELSTENETASTRPTNEFERIQLGICEGGRKWSKGEREGPLELLEEFILWISSIDKEFWKPLENVMLIIHNHG